jgi:cation diffusion facilitator family transporter
MKDSRKCDRCAKRTSLTGLVAGVFLAAFKFTIGVLGRSRALMASGMCNISDVSSGLIVMLSVRYSRRPGSRRYQYGYGKIEFVTQMVISMLMILGTAVLFVSSFFILAKRIIVIPHMVVFFVAIISAIVNGLIYKFASCGSKELNSPALKSHAEHNKIDVASSLLVAVGVIVTRMGIHWADPVIAIFECAHVIQGSWIIFWDGIKGLMDTSVSPEHIENIRDMVCEIDDIKSVGRVIARQSGPKIFLNISIGVDPELSTLDCKRIIQSLKAHLRANDRHLGDILVQVAPAK